MDQQVVVGGPLLGHLEPLVTPLIGKQSFCLFPHRAHVAVHSQQTGQCVGNIVGPQTIECARIVSDLLLLGDSVGSIWKFPLCRLESSEGTSAYHESLKGPIYHMDSSTEISKKKERVMKLAAISHSTQHLVFAFLEGKDEKGRLVRCKLNEKVEDMVTLGEFPPTRQLVDLLATNSEMLLVAYSDMIVIYVDNDKVKFHLSRSNALTCIALAPNERDVACGFTSGEIQVKSDIFRMAQEYSKSKQRYTSVKDDKNTTMTKPEHPIKSLVSRKLHWHAHPVATMAYDNTVTVEPLLYSAGEESVLITWQLSQGSDKPVQVLPRIALAGINRIAVTSKSQILVCSADNSVQLFASHDSSRLWKLQGVAKPKGIVWGSDRLLLCSDLELAPGFLHWYDPDKMQVKDSMQVVGFNRVSRAGPDSKALPSPRVSHVCTSGDDLITVDVVSTENKYVGRGGAVSTIRFWKKNQGRYAMTACMSHPHGSKNRVSAIAISPNGLYACSVSNDEKAFRVWNKVSDDEGKPEWICAFKVTIPSGLSNMKTANKAIDFSKDSTTLAICCGSSISLWDHADTTLLGTLRSADGRRIRSFEFLKSVKLMDMLLVVSKSGVSLQSPHGELPRKLGWSKYLSPESGQDVVDATYHEASSLIAVAVYEKKKNQSQIIWLDAVSGDVSSKAATDVDGQVVSFTCVPSKMQSRWESNGKTKIKDPEVFVLTTKDEIVHIRQAEAEPTLLDETIMGDGDTSTQAPTIPLVESDRKRPTNSILFRGSESSAKRRLVLRPFGTDGDDKAPLLSTDLPNLQGPFLTSFLSRHLVRGER